MVAFVWCLFSRLFCIRINCKLVVSQILIFIAADFVFCISSSGGFLRLRVGFVECGIATKCAPSEYTFSSPYGISHLLVAMREQRYRFEGENLRVANRSCFVYSGRNKALEVPESCKELHRSRKADERNSQQFHWKDLYRRNRENTTAEKCRKQKLSTNTKAQSIYRSIIDIKARGNVKRLGS